MEACLYRTVVRSPHAHSANPADLERVLQGLHDSEILCGIQNDPPAGGITAKPRSNPVPTSVLPGGNDASRQIEIRDLR
jgi:hypothetical protein